jgi:hypothetical protein
MFYSLVLTRLAVQAAEQVVTSASGQASAYASQLNGASALMPEPCKSDLTEFDPKTIGTLLEEQFEVIKPGSTGSNPFPTLIPRSSKPEEPDSIDSNYQVLAVRPFDDKGFFHHQKVLLVTVSHIFLEARIMTANRSVGMFALDGKKLTYLNGIDSAAEVMKILKKEDRSLSECDPAVLAALFSMTVLRQDNDRVDVVESPADILRWDRANATSINAKIKKGGMQRIYACTVDKSELEKCKEKFSKPQLLSLSKSGWRRHFVALLGWMNTVRVPFALVEYEINVSPKYDINVTKHILSAKIMS